MKRSIVFLTPASADKKGELVKGECVEVEYEDGPVQYLEPVSYADNDSDTDESGRSFDDLSDDELEAAVRQAVDDLEEAQAAGVSPTKMLRLEQTLKELRSKLPNPSAPPGDTSVAPKRMNRERRDGGDTGAITGPFPGEKKLPDSGPAWKSRQAAARQAAVKKKFFADIDASQAKRRKVRQARHSADVCCSGKYLCAKCQAKAATV